MYERLIATQAMRLDVDRAITKGDNPKENWIPYLMWGFRQAFG